jgi:hypothetical protein
MSFKQLEMTKLEIEYIVNKLSEQANVENQNGYKLNVGDKVRLMNKNIQ